jgi:hypothetical protein
VAVAGVTAGAAVLTLLFLRLAWRPVTDASGHRRRRLRLTVRSLLVLVAACGAAAALWTHFQIEKRLRFGPYAYGTDFPPARGDHEYATPWYERAVIEWSAYDGMLVAAAAAIVVVAAWQACRIAREREQSLLTCWRSRPIRLFWGRVLKSAGTSALAVALLLAIVYSAILLPLMRPIEEEYLAHQAWDRRPDAEIEAEIAREEARLRTDPSFLAEVNAEIAERYSRAQAYYDQRAQEAAAKASGAAQP